MDLEKIKMRCIECGDCWLWQGAFDSCGTPVLRTHGERKLTAVRRHIATLQGRRLDRLLASNECAKKDCVAPDHIRLMTRKSLQIRTADLTQYHKRISRNKKLAESARSKSEMTMELVQEIRNSDLPISGMVAAYGFGKSCIQQIKAGKTWKDYSSPWAGLL